MAQALNRRALAPDPVVLAIVSRPGHASIQPIAQFATWPKTRLSPDGITQLANRVDSLRDGSPIFEDWLDAILATSQTKRWRASSNFTRWRVGSEN